MKTPKLTGLLAFLLCILLLAASLEARTWKISHVRPQGTAIDIDLNWFSKILKEKSDGKLKTKIYAASALGDYTVVQERVGLGAVDMACQPPASAADKRFQMVYFPYMVKSWEQARKNYSPGAPIREIVGQLYAEQGIQLLAAWPVYFGGISLNTEPVAPGDPDADKGIKLRVPPMKTFQLLADKTGYLGTPIPFSDAFTAVQTGVVDGVIGSGAEGYYASFRDVTKAYIPANTHFEVWYMLISDGSMAELDAEDQAALQAAAEEFEAQRWTVAEEDQGKWEQRLADELGATVVDLTDEQLAAMAAKVRDEVWPVVLEDVGVEWGQAILDQVGASGM
jgi:TRAP-type C4-dicarboxylate transport system substrate-binding protein